MNTAPEESIGLTARDPYLDDTSAKSDSHLSVSDTLLEDDSVSLSDKFQQKPRWWKLFSFQNINRAWRKHSKPRNIIGEKTMIRRRKGSRLCLRFGFYTLVLL